MEPLGLSKREVEVLQAISKGMTNSQMGRKFHVSPGTIKKQVADLLLKLNVHDRASAVRIGIEKKLIKPLKAQKVDFGELLPEERKVSHMISEGMTNDEISDQLLIPKRTFETYLGKLFKKAGVANRYKLAAAYISWKIAQKK